ncbi:TetR/AcrR family transcriptional regulator [Bifidobacterium callimiconis]|uniref:AcrR family transcriptional regulator n=1 Tax=Bifidobacterium callimiconis TaxID=2306973 RepID=A0A430FBI9_9BIFI|nr:helix-turn-helix domain-containing protein [Bifidobacterium callimiconis]MBT1177078.1 TetR/AcrR family transcriptional regulator [Bifidobacterium callimiconis]RSX50158.1 AcrR family transcriptional regulator [Bifidobacterium callimiconis]
MTSATTASSTHHRTNREPDRREKILAATVEYFGTLGYYGTSIQKIATKVGLTKAGVLHYVGSKEGLLELVLTEMYDKETNELLASLEHAEKPSIAAMFRENVAINVKRPQLVHMFSTLSAEALDPNHPAHDYFAQRERNGVEQSMKIDWAVPDGVDPADVLLAGFSMMDGAQLRWLRTPGQDFQKMWARCEDVLFPLPLWEGYR